jgi:hypothetical protein
MVYIFNSILLANSIIIITISFCEGSRLTTEAQKSSKILSQIMCESEFLLDRKVDLVFLTTTMRMRNLNAETFLFTINWSVFMTVSVLYELIVLGVSSTCRNLSLQMISTIVTYLVITCQFGS